MAQKQYKRRIYIIDPEFQYGFIRKISIIAVLIIVMSLFFLAMVHQLYGSVQIEVAQPDPFAVSESITTLPQQISILKLLLPVMLICLLTTIVAIFFWGVIISHRMAGPLYRMRQTLDQMAQGDLSVEIRLRRKDDFKSLAENINNMQKRWRIQVKELKELCRRLEAGDEEMQKKHWSQFSQILTSFKTD